jgi:xanthine dehydrogenase YagS FAD-binding subunit
MMSNFTYVRPESLQQAISHLATEGARAHAGGTDLLGCLRDELFPASKIVSLSGLEDLQGVKETAGGGLRIGALTTIATIAAHKDVQERFTALADAAAEVASPQLRNQGTLGGNLCQKPRCWYYRGEFHCLRKGGDTCYAISGENQYHGIFGSDECCIVHPSDTAPALVALDATARIDGPDGQRDVKLADFFVLPAVDVQRETVLEPGEIVTEILLPPPPRGLHSGYSKVRARGSWDFALASLALALRFEGGKISTATVVLGGAAPVPWRAKEVEEIIVGSSLGGATVDRATVAVVAQAEPLDKNEYKLPLFQGLLEQELLAMRSNLD